MSDSNELFKRRRQRNRTKLRKTANNSVRLSVHRSSKHIYAQIIDDAAGRTLVSASSLVSKVVLLQSVSLVLPVPLCISR